ncbi:MAG: potassium channel protein [Melioribacteraceae bacterium]|nr:potassium channel protein [Melioribacteraceae bacterium]MCF8356488.1 potassium channel protein [Melioribacteraceae bacterium]MCF8394859.1 potassium channel protein [Melioribacteraceae bacterium]MCF8420587.1 potassium channel protein [Melioribacteraceae bacterium]
MHQKSLLQFKYGLGFLFTLIIVGTIGYELLEDQYSIIDSLYMTVITISTTGFKEVHDLSETGRLFTLFLIITGVITIAYTGSKAAQFLIESQVFRRKRMSRKLEMIGNHYIVCGYGRMGKQICEGLKENKELFVVVENDPVKIDDLIERELLYVNGDATSDDALIKAGVERAKGLVSVVKTDAENVFTTLTAKELNKNIFVVARAIDDGTESKLMKAGADKVVLPYELGGNRMVQLLLRPGVIDFIDGVARSTDVDISLEEITVHASSPLVGKTLADSPVRKELNIIIVAISRETGKFMYNPKSDTKFQAGDKLIAIGEENELIKFNELCMQEN